MRENLFLVFQFYPIDLIYMPVRMPVPYCLDYSSFAVSFEIEDCESCNVVPLFQGCFSYFGSLAFLKPAGILTGILLNL